MTYKTIKGSEFDITSEPAPFSMSVEALEGAGKTHFSLMDTPGPVVHVNFGDRDATWFLYQMSEERRKEVTMYDFQAVSSEGWSRKEGLEGLHDLSDIAKQHMEGGKLNGGTFIIDSGSSWWEIVQECYVKPQTEQRGEGKKIGGLEYMQGNLIVSGVVSWLKSQGAFVILTHRKRQDWGSSGPIPGSYSPQVNRKVPYLVEVRLDLFKTCDGNGTTPCGSQECRAIGHVGRTHKGRFLKFAAQTMLEGLEINPVTFGNVYKMYTGKRPPWYPAEEAKK